MTSIFVHNLSFGDSKTYQCKNISMLSLKRFLCNHKLNFMNTSTLFASLFTRWLRKLYRSKRTGILINISTRYQVYKLYSDDRSKYYQFLNLYKIASTYFCLRSIQSYSENTDLSWPDMTNWSMTKITQIWQKYISYKIEIRLWFGFCANQMNAIKIFLKKEHNQQGKGKGFHLKINKYCSTFDIAS